MTNPPYEANGTKATNSGKLREAWNVLKLAIESGHIPGATAAVSCRGGRVEFAAGYARTGAGAVPAQHHTLYDCASLTKVVVTLPLILIAIERGMARLEQPAADYIPELAAHGKGRITIRQLLTHTSGLPAHRDLHSLGLSRDETIAYICGLPPDEEPDRSMIYSDLGFILLGEIASRLFDLPLREAASRYIFEPLGMKDSCYCPAAERWGDVAATEFDERAGAYRQGVVHDDNAAALGGVSGHAGLFSTAFDLSRYADMWLNGGVGEGGRLLSGETVKLATASWTQAIEGANRGLGWVLKGDRWDASGGSMSDSCYGHTGFTGTSLWIDPAKRFTAVLLTNRVHFGRHVSIAELRQNFHDAAASIAAAMEA
ncbi:MULTISPECIES: serine hydrolase [unclassified Paenibacillus]|uniref:serine hydrolase domain-containing protein n=1 Tax=unclassified Paenibacillus TaxID=185978 RepID=UPI001C11E10C|nr:MULTISPECIES: serine hydrolase domain-containing protein [unclassified Paenibacillus]MBU5443922.1 beta-lactamase family protein [Paenibacillus sp. MSJ-34]CAH0121197.1 N-acetylmuramyl-L-alanine amidase [Paenibacillus sp. CECT 9249]